jgi:hypothetical protein
VAVDTAKCRPDSKTKHQGQWNRVPFAQVPKASVRRRLDGGRERSPASTPHAVVRFWTRADKAEYWSETVCPLMTQSGHLFLGHLVLYEPNDSCDDRPGNAAANCLT